VYHIIRAVINGVISKIVEQAPYTLSQEQAMSQLRSKLLTIEKAKRAKIDIDALPKHL